MDSTFERIYQIVRQIPKGKVSTYGQIAAALGMTKGFRIVGFALAACKDESIPCHRVVDRFGRTKSAFDVYGIGIQRAMLEAEGIEFSEDNTVDLQKYLWKIQLQPTTKHFISLYDYTKDDILKIFEIADALQNGGYQNFLQNKTIVMFFPSSSIRTRVTFEKGIHLLGGQTILFPPETLDKKEALKDVIGYLNNWTDAVVIRHSNINLIKNIAEYSKVPVINAMTSINHPCEVLSDLYSLSKFGNNYLHNKFLFCGRKCNIGLAWKELTDVMNLDFSQCCPKGYEMDNVKVDYDIHSAIRGKDIICTDSLPDSVLSDFKEYRITKQIMDTANTGALFNPCPPFYRGEEVSEDVINSPYFVGYEFKKYLLEIQQAILIFSLTSKSL